MIVYFMFAVFLLCCVALIAFGLIDSLKFALIGGALGAMFYLLAFPQQETINTIHDLQTQIAIQATAIEHVDSHFRAPEPTPILQGGNEA